MKERREVIKHSAAIHIQNNITLLQRRAWNVLLANAYDDLPERDTYRVSVRELMQALDYNSGDQEYVKEALKALTTCGVEWNVLGKDNSVEWGITTLLAQAIFKKGICTYAYSPVLRERLHNPRMYARISLSMQNKFHSKHALALWEICVDYLDESKQYGETPFIPLEQYRKIMGISAEMYSQFKIFNKWVIKDPIAEINATTDFHVSTDYERQQRRVIAVKFRVRRVAKVAHPNKHQFDLFPEVEDKPAVVGLLEEAGLSASDAWEIWQQQWEYVNADDRPRNLVSNPEDAFARYIREKVDLLNRQGKRLRSRTGFLIKAIKKNFAHPEFTADDQTRTNSETQERKRKLIEERSHLLSGQEQALDNLCTVIVEETPDVTAELLQEAITAGEIYKGSYEVGRSALENYRASEAVRNVINSHIIQRFRDRFQSIEDAYTVRFALIDNELSEVA